MCSLLLQALDDSNLVEAMVGPGDAVNGGTELIKICAMQFTQGGPNRVGFTTKHLTKSQLATAFKVYEAIITTESPELFCEAETAAIACASMAWTAKEYQASIEMATHVIERIDDKCGEAYRIRAFAYLMLKRYGEAREDLETALVVSPWLEGAKEPLQALTGHPL